MKLQGWSLFLVGMGFCLQTHAGIRIVDPDDVLGASDRFLGAVSFQDGLRCGDNVTREQNLCEIHCHAESGECRQYCQPSSSVLVSVTDCKADQVTLHTQLDLNGPLDVTFTKAVYDSIQGNVLRFFLTRGEGELLARGWTAAGLARHAMSDDDQNFIQLWNAKPVEVEIGAGETRQTVQALRVMLSVNGFDTDTQLAVEIPMTITIGRGLPMVAQLLDLYLYPNMGPTPAERLLTYARGTPAKAAPAPRAEAAYVPVKQLQLAKYLATASLSPDGKLLAGIGEANDRVEVWDLATGALLQNLYAGAPIQAYRWSADGRSVATAAVIWDAMPLIRHWELEFWDVATGKVTYDLEGLTRGVATVLDLPADPAGLFMALTYDDGTDTVMLESAQNAASITSFVLLSGKIATGRFTPDGQRFLTTSETGSATLWKVPAGAVDGIFKHGESLVTAELSADQSRLVTVGNGGADALLWDVATRKPLGHFAPEGGGVTFSHFARATGELISGMKDHTLRVWDSAGNPTATLSGHADIVVAGELPDATHAVTADASGKVILWEKPAGTRP